MALEINGHSAGSTPTRVECAIYFPTDVFHRAHDLWLAAGGRKTMTFSAFVSRLVEKALDQ